MTRNHWAALGLTLLLSGTALAAGSAFERMDSNKDGKISLDEFIADRTAKAKEQFAKKDTNRDGSLSAEEWKAIPKAMKADAATPTAQTTPPAKK